MQGTKNFQPKMFVNFRLDEHISKDNFYRFGRLFPFGNIKKFNILKNQ